MLLAATRPFILSVLIWRHAETLKMTTSLLCFCILWTLFAPSSATQTCAEVQFKNFNGSTLYPKEGNISVVFQFTTAKCTRQPERILVKVTSDNEGYTVEYCKVTIDKDSCKTSDTSLCRCLDKSGLIEFSKEINRTDNRRYTWIWSDSLSPFEGHRSIQIYDRNSPPREEKLSIKGPGVFVIDGLGSRTLTLECRPPEGSRTVWQGITCTNTNARDGLCTFIPEVADDGKVITCAAMTIQNDRLISKTNFTLQLKYPPRTAPVISGLREAQAVFLGDKLTLTCTVTGGKPLVSEVNFSCGQRKGARNGGNGFSVSSTLTFDPLTARDKGANCHCSALWSPAKEFYKMEDTAVLTVLDDRSQWGLAITGPENFVTNGSTWFTLTCVPVHRSPVLDFQWQGVQCQTTGTDVCYFAPKPEDDGNQISCTAHDPLNDSRTATASYTLNLRYPPPLPPTIDGITEGQPLSVGDTLVMTCTVTGGNPLVTAVRFTCGGEADNQDNVSNGSVSSSLTFNPVTAEHNGTVCLCTAVWSPKKELYPFEKSIVLTVSSGSPVKGAEQSLTRGAVAAVVFTCVIIGIAVAGVVAYFVFRKRADLYDHLNRHRHSEDVRVARIARPALSVETNEDLYENFSDISALQTASCEGIVTLNAASLPGKTCKGKSLLSFTSRKSRKDEPGSKAPVSTTSVPVATVSKIAVAQNEEYLEPVVACRCEEQTDESRTACPSDYYSYPKVAYKQQQRQKQ